MGGILSKLFGVADFSKYDDFVSKLLIEYKYSNPNDRHWIKSAFDHVLTELENRAGPIDKLGEIERKAEAHAIRIMSSRAASMTGDSIEAYTSRLGSAGGFMLSIYVENFGSKDPRIAAIVGRIRDWSEGKFD